MKFTEEQSKKDDRLIKKSLTVVEHASDNALLSSLVKGGDLPGALWKQGLFEGVNP